MECYVIYYIIFKFIKINILLVIVSFFPNISNHLDFGCLLIVDSTILININKIINLFITISLKRVQYNIIVWLLWS